MTTGTIIYKNKERYVGEVRDTKIRHGRGRMYKANGSIDWEGVYRDGLPSLKFNYWKLEDK